MKKEKFLIVGSGGRESAFALKLYKDTVVFAYLSHENPTIISCVKKSGGQYMVGDVNNPSEVALFAKQNEIDYAFVSADDPLANGVVDTLLDQEIKAVGGTKEATKIEWDKIYSIEMMKHVCPDFTPFYVVVGKKEELDSALKEFKSRNLEVVVKPQGLTGGKGVKVMPEHLKSYRDCFDYAVDLLKKAPCEKVLLVEKLKGLEFTIMGITDGHNLALSPASYDYPFRFEDDKGAGTGGMGCFTNNSKKLPFMSNEDLEDCREIMQKIIDQMRKNGLNFTGVLNGGFFKTKDGIKFMEFNGRFGDPEGLNILAILETPFCDVIKSMWNKTVSEENINFIDKASVIKYLVAHEYPNPSKQATSFTMDEKAIEKMGVTIFFASSIRLPDGSYETLKKSRAIAFGATSDTVSEASDLINEAIEKYVDANLEYRKDIGSKANLEKLSQYKFS